MKKIIITIIIFQSFIGLCQEGYFNDDGTVSKKAERELFVNIFNENSTNGTRYEIENKYLVVTTKIDCGDRKFELKEMQQKALFQSFSQLLNEINAFKNIGYKNLYKKGFEGMIFKTNTICMYKTRRYHFKFDILELDNLPDYMDISELRDYVLIENKSKNIIYAKNP